MADFEFLQNSISKKWVILAPRRSKRTNVGKEKVAVCPFCPGRESEDHEVYRIGGKPGDSPLRQGDSEASNWNIRVVPNKFPFTSHHEIIIHSPDHHKNFDELPFEQVELIFKTYRHRFNALKKHGEVYIFHNKGHAAGESLPHPHTQITVIPEEMTLEIPKLNMGIYRVQSSKLNFFDFLKSNESKNNSIKEVLETDSFFVFCPQASEWPDEVWVAPKENENFFGSINDHQIKDFAFTISRLVQIFDMRHGYEFPFNFYISPDKNWYLRFIPRLKTIGGFELGTNIIVNTQDPKETFAFIKEHFWQPDNEKIKVSHQAEYRKSV